MDLALKLIDPEVQESRILGYVSENMNYIMFLKKVKDLSVKEDY